MTDTELTIDSIESIKTVDANKMIEEQNPQILNAKQEAVTNNIKGKSKLNGHVNNLKIGAIYFFPTILVLIMLSILVSYGLILESLNKDLLQSKIENWISAGFSFSFGVGATIVYNHLTLDK